MAKVAHLKPHQFQPGNSANPAGRPKGARNKLTETFLEDAYEAWKKHGPKALETMAEKHPEKFVQVCASLMPKNVNLNVGIQDQLSELLERMQEIPPVTVNGEAAEIIENPFVGGDHRALPARAANRKFEQIPRDLTAHSPINVKAFRSAEVQVAAVMLGR